MKVTYHVPTEQYGFVEVEAECNSLEQNDSYENVRGWVLGKSGEGLAESDFNKILDKYMSLKGVGAMTSEEYEKLDARQQNIIQTLKRAYKRQQNG